MTALAEAPLGIGGGTIGVGVSAPIRDRGTPFVSAMTVIAEDGHEAVHFLDPTLAPSVEVRFAEIDGDGRTDLVLWQGAAPIVLLAPPPRADVRHFVRDPASEWAAAAAASADAAVASAISVPTRGVRVADACALLRRARSPAGLAQVSEPAARSVYSGLLPVPHGKDRPGALRRAPGATLLSALPAEVTRQLPRFCGSLSCDPRRPICEGRFASRQLTACVVSTARFFFAWTSGKLTLTGLAAVGQQPPSRPGPIAPSCK